ncbi:uncharacterized protein LOC112880817 [Panicum hallii]|uniref:uncharacterized protein LOC112880817 n=1 Tax=Panicum hallii TaxID=206008 RepID=UPI000DF4D609|nr:uncharacterized protein LOC112880817 [Panicum hallii]
MMRLMLKARHLWDAVDHDRVDEDDDLMALEAICKAVPAEMQETMANKPSAKAAWDNLKTANLGVERDGESIDDFSERIGNVVQQLRTLGDEIDEGAIIHKFLQALPPRLHQIAMSIETLLDVEEVPVEELAHAVQAEEEQEPTLLVAAVTAQADSTSLPPPVTPAPGATVHLNEDQLFVQLGEKSDGDTTRWILDTGATNHMTSARSAFAELDLGVRGSVRFGDGSTVSIEGRGMVLFKCKTGEH